MKKHFKFISAILMVIVLTVLSSCPAWAFITGRNYGLKEGATVHWNGDDYFVRPNWDVYFDSFSNHQGTAMNFSKTETFVDNGYLVAGRDQWDDWVAAFGENYGSVVSEIKYTKVITPSGPVDIAWLTQIANVCGWRVKDWDNAGWAIYEKIPPDTPPEPINQPPTAIFDWASKVYAGDIVNVTDHSFDADGEIVDWEWYLWPSSGNPENLGEAGGTIVFTEPGTYNLELTVTDDDGAADSTTKKITVLEAIPDAEIDISGTLKENRKVIFNSSGSSSPKLYPIDHSKDEWVITPVSGGTFDDIKSKEQNGSSKEVLFKKTGTYRIGLRVHNSIHSSEWTYSNFVIVPDDPPLANFEIPSSVFRNPLDLSYASITPSDRSLSLDGDIVAQRTWKYKFDSNNDGSFLDESWASLDEGNNVKPLLRVDHVGNYLFSLEVKESFGQETIQEFVTEADYRKADTAAKPESGKISEVKNIAPVTSFTATMQPKADIVFTLGNTDPARASILSDEIDSLIFPKLLSGNIDSKISIIDTTAFEGNLVSDPSFDSTNYISITTSPWTAKGSIYICARTTTGLSRTGSKSLLIEEFSRFDSSIGTTQQLSGWSPGDSVELTWYINVKRYVQGNFTIDLVGYNKTGNLVFDSPGESYNSGITDGWLKLSTTEFIPANVVSLHLRIWASGYPKMTMYVDDVAVRKKSFRPINQVFNDITWRGGSERFLVNLSDLPSYQNPVDAASFAAQLRSSSVDYTVLGTDANKPETENIIALNSPIGAFFNNSNLAGALDSLGERIINKSTSNPNSTVHYLLLSDIIQSIPTYSDYENDPKYLSNWHYTHDPNYVDNNTGMSLYNQKTLPEPLNKFDKCGKYDVSYTAMDDPTKGDASYANYRLWSNPTPISFIVHRKPVANFTVVPGTLNITDHSYDPDFQYKRADKGVAEWVWKWRKVDSTDWTVGRPAGIAETGEYVVRLEVKDIYDTWSDPTEKTITVADLQKPPVADFNWSPTLVFEGDNLALNNLSYDPEGEPLTYLWTVFNPQGITSNHSTKNANLNNVLPGTYWVTMRVWDPGGLTDVLTKSVIINNLSVTGSVKHTPEWNTNRISYNRAATGKDDAPRAYNVFWAGETFILEADTTDTTTSSTKAESVTVKMLANSATATLTPNANKTRWSGILWQPDFEQLPDGDYTFRFTGTYSNGTVKTDDVRVTISGTWQDYFNYHRSW